MVKTEQVRRCQGLEKIRRNVAAMCNPHNVFLIDCALRNIGLFWKEIWLCQKTLTLYYCFHNYTFGNVGEAA